MAWALVELSVLRCRPFLQSDSRLAIYLCTRQLGLNRKGFGTLNVVVDTSEEWQEYLYLRLIIRMWKRHLHFPIHLTTFEFSLSAKFLASCSLFLISDKLHPVAQCRYPTVNSFTHIATEKRQYILFKAIGALLRPSSLIVLEKF